jgi:nicotinamide-nucleotide amidase|tara:strand:+ start:12164 stop:12631 length:468 start_codon:yes stop_codon:yes gene_type:complete
MSLAAQILDKAKQSGIMIASAESCTGGMVMAALTDIAGSSSVAERGFVTYTNAAKMQMLGVQAQTLDTFGAVSKNVAAEMAQGALANSEAQLTVSITGIAGPGGSDHKPEGRVCFGVSDARKTTTETVEFGALGRENVRIAARDHALKLLLDRLN